MANISIYGHLSVGKQNIVSYLSSIYGLNRSRAFKVCAKYGISIFSKTETISDANLVSIKKFVEKNYILEKNLKKLLTKRLVYNLKQGTFRSKRFLLGLPVNGQSSRANGKTAKKLLKFLVPKGFATPTNFASSKKSGQKNKRR